MGETKQTPEVIEAFCMEDWSKFKFRLKAKRIIEDREGLPWATARLIQARSPYPSGLRVQRSLPERSDRNRDVPARGPRSDSLDALPRRQAEPSVRHIVRPGKLVFPANCFGAREQKMSSQIFKPGEKFGFLTLIGRSYTDKNRAAHWECLCSCGQTVYPLTYSLRSGRTTSCGCRGKHADICGRKFGRLIPLRRVSNMDTRVAWECSCECGNTIVTARAYLLRGKVTHCGCVREERFAASMVGRVFGYLTVISLSRNAKGRARWVCRCVCGEQTVLPREKLISGLIKSCGCRRLVGISAAHTTHGYSRKGKTATEYVIFTCAKGRCRNPHNKSYKDYGGRGIKFKFSSFEQFFAELGPRPTGMTLDRINNDGHYEPGNVRWATRSQQARNRRKAIRVERKSA